MTVALYECRRCGGLFTQNHERCPACNGQGRGGFKGSRSKMRRLDAEELLSLLD